MSLGLVLWGRIKVMGAKEITVKFRDKVYFSSEEFGDDAADFRY